MAVLGLPIAFAATSFGIGLFVERLFRARLLNALLLPVGMCGSIVVSLAVYWTGSGDVPAVAITVVIAVAGLLLARDGVRSRLNPGWPGVAALATYLLFVAPELLTGHWTWSGYNFVNDTSTQWALTSYMKMHGTTAVGLLPPRSTTTEFVRAYLGTAYPLGTQAQLATLSGLLHTQPAVLYQGYISTLAATAAMSLATLSDRFLTSRMAAVGGFLAAGAALTYQYALQGSIKELGALTTSVAALAVARHVIREGIDTRGALLTAVPLAALLDSYYSAGIPFAGAVAAVALAIGLIVGRRVPDLRMAGALGLAAIATLVIAAPASASMSKSLSVVSSGFGSGTASAAPALGQLARPLPLSEVSGIWLNGDYRLPIVTQPEGKLTALLTVVVFVLALTGVLLALRDKEIGPAALLAGMGLVMAVLLPRLSPYAAAKVLAIASPAFVLAAFVGAQALRRAVRPRWQLRRIAVEGVALFATLSVGLGVLASDALAYHQDNVAPTSRMLALAQVGDHFAGKGLILWNEFEEYAKDFADHARINVPTESFTPLHADLVTPTAIFASYFDLDLEKVQFVESFPIVVMRISPSASRPPANYRLAYENSYYEAWVRQARPVVLRHLGLQSTYAAAQPVSCKALRGFVAGAGRGSSLVAAVYPHVSSIAPADAPHTTAWQIDPIHPDALGLNGAGVLEGTVLAPRTAQYQVWVEGSFERPITVEVDGRKVGRVAGINTPEQWLTAGSLELTRGSHEIRLIRPTGDLAPGDGGGGWLGPVAIEERQSERLQRLPVEDWRALCGRSLDWIELVGP